MDYVQRTLEFEGAWSNDDRDPGGATMWGLTERFNPELASKIRNRTLRKDEALDAIYKKYFLPLARIEDVNKAIGFIVFDARFHGMSEAIKSLQTHISGILGIRLVIDGVWGEKTAKAALMLTPDNVLAVLNKLKQESRALGESAANRVIAYQQAHNMPVYDYENGFTNRQNKRMNAAIQFA
jgi:lysozyme family protein